jgi:hypothetical protein
MLKSKCKEKIMEGSERDFISEGERTLVLVAVVYLTTHFQ